MDREALIGRINDYFGERENIEELDEVVTEINNLYERVENTDREWREKYKARFLEKPEVEEKETEQEEKVVTIDDLFTKKEG
jgi:hypothetical protein|nr:MAG TPA: hypothetical protein [Caudoviricetes sp.]